VNNYSDFLDELALLKLCGVWSVFKIKFFLDRIFREWRGVNRRKSIPEKKRKSRASSLVCRVSGTDRGAARINTRDEPGLPCRPSSFDPQRHSCGKPSLPRTPWVEPSPVGRRPAISLTPGTNSSPIEAARRAV